MSEKECKGGEKVWKSECTFTTCYSLSLVFCGVFCGDNIFGGGVVEMEVKAGSSSIIAKLYGGSGWRSEFDKGAGGWCKCKWDQEGID